MPNVVPNSNPLDTSVQGHLNLMTDTELLPKTLVGDIFSKAKSLSRLMQLGQQSATDIRCAPGTAGLRALAAQPGRESTPPVTLRY